MYNIVQKFECEIEVKPRQPRSNPPELWLLTLALTNDEKPHFSNQLACSAAVNLSFNGSGMLQWQHRSPTEWNQPIEQTQRRISLYPSQGIVSDPKAYPPVFHFGIFRHRHWMRSRRYANTTKRNALELTSHSHLDMSIRWLPKLRVWSMSCKEIVPLTANCRPLIVAPDQTRRMLGSNSQRRIPSRSKCQGHRAVLDLQSTVHYRLRDSTAMLHCAMPQASKMWDKPSTMRMKRKEPDGGKNSDPSIPR